MKEQVADALIEAMAVMIETPEIAGYMAKGYRRPKSAGLNELKKLTRAIHAQHKVGMNFQRLTERVGRLNLTVGAAGVFAAALELAMQESAEGFAKFCLYDEMNPHPLETQRVRFEICVEKMRAYL